VVYTATLATIFVLMRWLGSHPRKMRHVARA
jgi:hypothetical protein